MNFYKRATVLALGVLCVGCLPMSADAKNRNNNDMTTQVTANNFTVTNQNLSGQINTYLTNGQISQQQANDFNNQLSQISSRAMQNVSNPANAQMSVSEFGNFTNSLNAAASANGTYNSSIAANSNNSWQGFRNRFANSRAEHQAYLDHLRAEKNNRSNYNNGHRWGQ